MNQNAKPAVIPPTVGRVVLFFEQQGATERAALVAVVHNERMVNLMVVDDMGSPCGRTSVPLVQPGDDIPQGCYCTWMPYQIGQAQKAEEIAQRLQRVAENVETVLGPRVGFPVVIVNAPGRPNGPAIAEPQAAIITKVIDRDTINARIFHDGEKASTVVTGVTRGGVYVQGEASVAWLVP